MSKAAMKDVDAGVDISFSPESMFSVPVDSGTGLADSSKRDIA